MSSFVNSDAIRNNFKNLYGNYSGFEFAIFCMRKFVLFTKVVKAAGHSVPMLVVSNVRARVCFAFFILGSFGEAWLCGNETSE